MTAQNPGAAPIADHDSSEAPAVAGYDRRSSLETRAIRVVQRFFKRRAQRLLWYGIGAIGYLMRRRHPANSPLYPGNPTVLRILVVRVDLLGDTVLTTPAIAALRRGYPHARIDALVQQSTADVLVAERDIAHVITYDPQALRR